MYSFPIWNQSVVPRLALIVASWPAYTFPRRQIKWSDIPIPFRIFHSWLWTTVKGFSVLNEAEVDVFPEFPCFLYDPTNAGNSTSGPLPLRKPACTSGLSQFTYCWGQACRILSITLLACEMSVTVWLFEHSLALPLFGTGMKTDLLQSYRHC